MNRPPLQFGIIIPTYNRPALLGLALAAVKAQTYPHWRLFICDDASAADYSPVMAMMEDDRIEFIRRPLNGGCNAARNTGIDAAIKSGVDFIITSGDDEEIDPRALEEAVTVIDKHPDCGWFISNTAGDEKAVSKKIVTEGYRDWLDDYVYGKKLRGDKAHVISTAALGNIRYDGRYRNANMWPFFIPLSAKTRLWAYPYPSKVIRYLDDGITKNSSRYPKTWLEIYSRFAKHACAIRHRPTKFAAYRYLVLELLKTPKRVLYLFRRPKRAGADAASS